MEIKEKEALQGTAKKEQPGRRYHTVIELREHAGKYDYGSEITIK